MPELKLLLEVTSTFLSLSCPQGPSKDILAGLLGGHLAAVFLGEAPQAVQSKPAEVSGHPPLCPDFSH